MFNNIYEIRDLGTKTRFIFHRNKEFTPDKSLSSFTVKLIPEFITPMDTINLIKKKIMTYARPDLFHHHMCLWAEFVPETVDNLFVKRIITGLTENTITVKIAHGVRAKTTSFTFDSDGTKNIEVPNNFKQGVIENKETETLYSSFSSAVSAASAGAR